MKPQKTYWWSVEDSEKQLWPLPCPIALGDVGVEEKEILETGFVGKLWGADIHVSCPPGEVLARDEVVE